MSVSCVNVFETENYVRSKRMYKTMMVIKVLATNIIPVTGISHRLLRRNIKSHVIH